MNQVINIARRTRKTTRRVDIFVSAESRTIVIWTHVQSEYKKVTMLAIDYAEAVRCHLEISLDTHANEQNVPDTKSTADWCGPVLTFTKDPSGMFQALFRVTMPDFFGDIERFRLYLLETIQQYTPTVKVISYYAQ